jgi:hypothetical protein
MNAAGADVHYPHNKVALIAYSATFSFVSTDMSSSIVIAQIVFPLIWPLYFPFLECLLIVSLIKFCCFSAFRLLNVTLLLLQSLLCFFLLHFIPFHSSVSECLLYSPPQSTISGSFCFDEKLRETWRFNSFEHDAFNLCMVFVVQEHLDH